MLDLTATGSSPKGFRGGFSDGTCGFVGPEYRGAYFGKAARFSLDTFGNVEVLDFTTTGSSLKYVGPYGNGAKFAKVARFNLNDCGNVEVLDLTATDCSLKGSVAESAMGPTATPCLSTTAHTSARSLASIRMLWKRLGARPHGHGQQPEGRPWRT